MTKQNKMNKYQLETKLTVCWNRNIKTRLLREFAKERGYTWDITGDACKGDEVIFARALFSGSYPKAKYDSDEVIIGTITRDSYGAAKQQHTFTITQECGSRITIKGRNLYSIAVFAKPRVDRAKDLEDKHARGNKARKARKQRRSSQQ